MVFKVIGAFFKAKKIERYKKRVKKLSKKLAKTINVKGLNLFSYYNLVNRYNRISRKLIKASYKLNKLITVSNFN